MRSYGRAFTGLRVNFKLAADQVHPLAHADQAQARSLPPASQVGTNAVISDREDEFVASARQVDLRRCRMAVLGNIVQRFLRHSQKCERHDSTQVSSNIVTRIINSNLKAI
jgi:hypothetical protein